MSSQPRLLMMLPYVPYPVDRGTYQRVFHLAEILGSQFQLDLFCLDQEGREEEARPVLEKFCHRFQAVPFEHPPWPALFPDRLLDSRPTTVRHWQSDSVSEALEAFRGNETYDLVHFCDLVLWPYMEAAFPGHPRLILDRSRVDWLFQTEELQHLQLGFKDRLLRRENLAKIARMEKQVYAKVALEVVCGQDDRAFLQEKLGDASRIYVLPNGYNHRFFDENSFPPRPREKPTALFCGALDYSPNINGLQWYFREVHETVLEKEPDFRLQLVGKQPAPEVLAFRNFPGVEFIGEVDDVRPYYQQSWFQIVPLFIGGGTRLKIVECLGLSIPVLSTALGAQGLELENEKDLLLADTAETFTAAMIRLLSDEHLRRTLGARGQATVSTHYTWPNLGQKLGDQYRTLLRSR